MMIDSRVTYYRDLENAILIVEGNENAILPTGQEKMLLKNEIEGLLYVECIVKDEVNYYHYNISGSESLSTAYAYKKISYQDTKILLHRIIAILSQTERYLLENKYLVFDPKYIFLQENMSEMKMIFCPYLSIDKIDFMPLIEFLLDKVDYDDQGAVEFVYQVAKASEEENFSLSQTMKSIEKNLLQLEKPANNPLTINSEVLQTMVVNEENIYVVESSKFTEKEKRFLQVVLILAGVYLAGGSVIVFGLQCAYEQSLLIICFLCMATAAGILYLLAQRIRDNMRNGKKHTESERDEVVS